MLQRLSCLLIASSLCLSAAAAADEALVAELHDLRGLAPDLSHESAQLPLLPLLSGEAVENELGGSWFHEWIYNLLVDRLFEEQFQYEDRVLHVSEDGLFIQAPAAVQQQVRELLGYLRSVVSRSATLRLESYVAVPGRALPVSLTAGSLDALVEDGSLRLLDTRRERVRLGQPLLREQLLHHELLREWQLSIAQNSVGRSCLPERISTGSTGLIWVDAGLPGAGRCTVGVADLRSTLIALETAGFDGQDEVVLDSRSVDLTGERHLDLQRIGATNLAGEADLAPGESTLMGGFCQTLEGTSGGLLRVVLETLDPEPAPLRLGEHTVYLADLTALVRPALLLPTIHSGQLRGEFEGDNLAVGYRSWQVPTLAFAHGDLRWSGLLEQRLETFEYQDEGRYDSNGRWHLMSAPGDALVRWRTDLAKASRPADGRRVEWRLLATDGTTLSQGWLSISGRGDALVVLGESRGAMHGTDVEVASGAVGVEARLLDVFDGVWVRARGAGPDAVELNLAGNRVLSRVATSMGRGLEGLFDRLSYASNDLSVLIPSDGAEHELALLAGGQRLIGRALVADGER